MTNSELWLGIGGFLLIPLRMLLHQLYKSAREIGLL